MCGRFTLRTSNRALVEQFLLPASAEFSPRYNIAPTQAVAAIRIPSADLPRELVMMHWGLIPSWASDPSIGNRMINARAETLAEKPSFRGALAKRRCLILADGFYEWKKEGKQKQPYLIGMPDGRPFAFAGLWDCWKRQGEPLQSCTIITTQANGETRPLHDRMPVILEPQDYDRWLDPSCQSITDVTPLLRPFPDGILVARPVSTLVNNARHEDPGCIESLSDNG